MVNLRFSPQTFIVGTRMPRTGMQRKRRGTGSCRSRPSPFSMNRLAAFGQLLKKGARPPNERGWNTDRGNLSRDSGWREENGRSPARRQKEVLLRRHGPVRRHRLPGHRAHRHSREPELDGGQDLPLGHNRQAAVMGPWPSPVAHGLVKAIRNRKGQDQPPQRQQQSPGKPDPVTGRLANGSGCRHGAYLTPQPCPIQAGIALTWSGRTRNARAIRPLPRGLNFVAMSPKRV